MSYYLQDGGLKTFLGTHFRRYVYKDGLELEILERKDDIKDSSLREILETEFGLHVWPVVPLMRDLSDFTV
jgi:hypothetical protein